jgi:hypothetical protein
MRYIPVLVILFLLIACTAQLKVPTNLDAQRGAGKWENYDSLQLAQGFLLYKNKCGHCHNLHLPKEFAKLNLDSVMAEMSAKAKLNPEQTASIERYLWVMMTDTL